jgi:ribosomal protein S18 acetylase RimI-like enzyme
LQWCWAQLASRSAASSCIGAPAISVRNRFGGTNLDGKWATSFAGRFVAVVEDAGRLAGFSELEANGHIDRVSVSADCQGQEVGRALLAEVVVEARKLGLVRLFVEASITTRPFFESQGFAVLAPQVVVCRGVEFVNCRMERLLAEPGALH